MDIHIYNTLKKIVQVIGMIVIIILCNIAYYCYLEVNPYLEWLRENRRKTKRRGDKK